MKILERILLFILSLIVLALIIGFVLLNSLKKAALPDYSEDKVVQGLSNEVTVIRDSFAIPHIFAENENDLYKSRL